MRYHIWTEGCQMNEADSEKLAAGLLKLGWEPAAKVDEADLAVVNTCVVRQKAEDRAVGYMSQVRKLKESREGMQIAVMGCMVGPRTDDLRGRFPFVDVWARPQNFEVIIRHLMPEGDLGGEFWPDTFPEPKGPTAFVPVVHGCNKFCTYCIVPYRRGREKSRPVDEIVREVASHARGGVREVTLLGQTVEAYGKDLPAHRRRGPEAGPRGLVRSAERDPGDCAHPLPDFVSAGHDRPDHPLGGRTAEGVRALQHPGAVRRQRGAGPDAPRLHDRRVPGLRGRIRQHVPHASLSTDVIVGFCGETEAQFLNTMRVLEDVRFDKVHVAAYSPRPGTIAWRHMEDTLPQAEKMRRLHAVEELQERVSREHQRPADRHDARGAGRGREGRCTDRAQPDEQARALPLGGADRDRGPGGRPDHRRDGVVAAGRTRPRDGCGLGQANRGYRCCRRLNTP